MSLSYIQSISKLYNFSLVDTKPIVDSDTKSIYNVETNDKPYVLHLYTGQYAEDEASIAHDNYMNAKASALGTYLPHILVYDIIDDKHAIIIQQYVGVTLNSLGTYDADWIQILKEFKGITNTMVKSNIFQYDMHPGNICYKDGHLYLIDFEFLGERQDIELNLYLTMYISTYNLILDRIGFS